METNVQIPKKVLEHEELIAKVKTEDGDEQFVHLNTTENHNSLPSTSIKLEPDNNITNESAINHKKEDDETVHEIKREDLPLNTEGEDDNSKKGARRRKIQPDKNTTEKLSCKYSGCGYKTLREDDLNRHLKLKHHENFLQIFYCDQCDYKTFKKGSMNTHIMAAKHTKCSSENYSNYRTQKIDLSQNQNQEYLREDYECDLCDYKTYNKKYLSTHVLVRHTAKKYSCDHCDFKTHRNWNLNIHLTTKHKSLIQKLSCDQCDYHTYLKENLDNHIFVKHERRFIKKYTCDCCDYKTRRKADLQRHKTSKH